MDYTKKGDGFLANTPINELKKLYKKEKNSKAQVRLLSLILRKEGKSLTEISSSIKKPFTTISDWLRRVENEGIHRVYSIKQTGKPSRLTKEQLNFLKKILENSPEEQDIPLKMWTTSLVQYVIKKLFGVLYKVRNVLNIVKKLGFSWKVPRQEHIKKNKKAVEKFKKNLKLKYNITLNLDSRSSVLMKSTLK